MESIPLLKYLVEAGLGARRQVVSAIKQGRVTVNGKTATGYTMPIYPKLDEIIVDGKKVKFKPNEALVFIVNKPKDVLSTTRDEHGRKTVIDMLPERYRSLGLYPAGRLDYDSTGLLILTNDGNLTYRLTHPRFEHEKEYIVTVNGILNEQDREKLQKGVQLEDGMTYPARIKEVPQAAFTYSITIHEGRHRQVKRMFLSVGHEVKSLKRVRIGRLELGDLEEGQVKKLSQAEIGKLLRR
ncbi:MAG: rRNA pseudouridine synthase [Dehalococcoidia bacterium]|nr:rRNA pseudouridine synthase [Dehalococcoidia bacterium]